MWLLWVVRSPPTLGISPHGRTPPPPDPPADPVLRCTREGSLSLRLGLWCTGVGKLSLRPVLWCTGEGNLSLRLVL